MKTPSSRKEQQWPYIRFSKPEKAWLVDARTKAGGSRKFFPKKGHAETYAQQCRVQREGHGTGGFANAEIAEFGKTVHDAISFYLAHLRQQKRSVPLAEAITELVELRRRDGKPPRYCHDVELRLGLFKRDFPATTIVSFTAKEFDAWLTGLSIFCCNSPLALFEGWKSASEPQCGQFFLHLFKYRRVTGFFEINGNLERLPRKIPKIAQGGNNATDERPGAGNLW